MNGISRRYTQSASYENTGSEPTRVRYLSRYNQDCTIDNDTRNEVFQIRPEPTDAIYEPVIHHGALPDSRSEGHSGPEELRVGYSIDNNGSEFVHFLPPPNIVVSENLEGVIHDLEAGRNSRSDSLNVHFSSNSNEREARYRKLTNLQIFVRVILSLMVVFIIVCCIARLVEPRSSTSVTLVSLFLALGCFALYILTIFCKICTLPWTNEPADFDF